MKKTMKPQNFEYTEIGDVILLTRKNWNIVKKWLRGNGVEIEETYRKKRK